MTNRDRAYKEAGVDIQAGNQLVQNIKSIVASTFTKGVMTDIGGFGGLFRPDLNHLQDPVLVAATDGVGTKLKLAFTFDVHHTIGIDLVAMSVNDVVVQGAKPLFFLDYFATGKLEIEKTRRVIEGIAIGCKQAGCALLGGETAEMPDFYGPGEYDLSGFCVGIVDNNKIIDGAGIRTGDIIIGLASSGLHSNGYSLVRKILADSGLNGDDNFPGTEQTVKEVLLEPTRIYVPIVLNLLRDLEVKGLVHITGGGFYDNITRILPKGLKARIDFGRWEVLPIFHWLKNQASLSWEEMLQIFNCGIGFMVVVSAEIKEDVLSRLKALNCPAWEIGQIESRKEGEEAVQILFD